MTKPILCLDFDGVLHSYTSGWKGADVVSDPPVPGALNFILEANEHFDVQVCSSRSHQPNGIAAMRLWFEIAFYGWFSEINVESALAASEEAMKMITFPTHKPSAMVTIDDRALTFTGSWPTIDVLKAFKPWNKK